MGYVVVYWFPTADRRLTLLDAAVKPSVAHFFRRMEENNERRQIMQDIDTESIFMKWY
jgi:hypothetical protein